MGTQHDRRNQQLCCKRWGRVERNRVAFATFGMPRPPWRDVLLQHAVERLRKAADCQRRRRFGAAPKTEREHYAAQHYASRKLGY